MPGRPGWNEEYWKRLDKETQKRMRTSCPRCGSSETYYNRQFKTWRGKCEHTFVVKGYDGTPWWKRLFGK